MFKKIMKPTFADEYSAIHKVLLHYLGLSHVKISTDLAGSFTPYPMNHWTFIELSREKRVSKSKRALRESPFTTNKGVTLIVLLNV